MHGSLGIENRIRREMQRHDFNVGFLAALASQYGIPGCSEATLTRSLAGKPLANQTATQLAPLLDKIAALCEAIHPVPPAFRDAAAIKPVLDAMESGALKIFTVHEHEEKPEAAYRVALQGGFFAGCVGGKPVVRDHGIAMTLPVAGEVVVRLGRQGIDGATLRPAESPGDVISDLSEAWQPSL